MRKIITTALFIVLTLSVQSQSLMDMFKTSSSSSSTTQSEPSIPFTATSLNGSWSYSKVAVGITDDSPLKGFAGDAVIGQVTNLLNSLAPNLGVVEGLFIVTFNASNRLIFQIEAGRANGTYTKDIDGSTIEVSVGNVNNIEIGTLTAEVTMYNDSATLLFDAKDLIVITDKIPAVVKDSQYQMVRGVVNGVDGLLLGCSLSRK